MPLPPEALSWVLSGVSFVSVTMAETVQGRVLPMVTDVAIRRDLKDLIGAFLGLSTVTTDLSRRLEVPPCPVE